MKTRWAYVWEYTNPDTDERTSTFLPVTVDEFVRLTGFVPADVDARALEATKVDRNVVPLSAGVKRIPKMPDFVPPTEDELRTIWRARRDPEVRRLILEIVALRKSLLKIQDWHKCTDRSTEDKGDLGGPHGPFQRLRHLLRDELRRAKME